jgi:hypothetical protein
VSGVITLLAVAGPATAETSHAHGPIKGIVPTRGLAKPAGTSSTTSNLIYHGGPVLNDNTAYAIFWSPSNWSNQISSGYQSLIERFFKDVATATTAGTRSNVYYAATQYGPTTYGTTLTNPGSLQNFSTFGGAYVDHDPISNGCKDRGTSICVTDSQVVQELGKAISAAGWQAGTGKIFFMFTAQGVGSCYSRSSCSFTQWCAYHSNSASMLYANMPFADTVSAACDAGFHPNATIDPYADATINVTSHEHNESITDPLGSAWYNSSGYEDGDLCAWNFGTMLGGSGSSQYNQMINNDGYALQQEWSNSSTGCVLGGI